MTSLKFNLSTRLRATTAILALISAGQAPAALVQYGFDFTSGSVQTNGGTVSNDGTGSFNAGILRGDGGTYSSDIPAAGLRQFTTGTGSLSTGSGAIRTGTGAFSGEGVVSNAAITAAGGLTLEIWVKGGNNGTAFTVAGAFGISGSATGYTMFNGANVASEIVTAPADRTVWTHVAAVYANPSQNGVNLNTDMQLYINGVLAGTKATVIPFDLTRGLGVGDHPLFPGGGDAFNGLLYEPRVSLGALQPPAFTFAAVPEPAGLALLGAAGMLFARRRRN